MTPVDSGELIIGPLTASEWASFALGDERNPLAPCCGNISEVRDAVFDVLRMGADPLTCWRRLAAVWHIVEDHYGPDTVMPPTLRKLYVMYVADREVPGSDEGRAYLFARKADDVRQYVDVAGESWDLSTHEGRMRCLARLGTFIGYVRDPDERYDLVRRLAGQMVVDDDRQVAFAVDVLRLANGLPYEPTPPRSAAVMPDGRWDDGHVGPVQLFDQCLDGDQCSHCAAGRPAAPIEAGDPRDVDGAVNDLHEDVAVDQALRLALPPAYHRPVFIATGRPQLWVCACCWIEGTVTGWPCTVAQRHGQYVARSWRIEFTVAKKHGSVLRSGDHEMIR